MKTLELKLKKDVLIVDAENGFNHFKIYDDEIGFIFIENGIPRKELVKGSYKFLCKGSELTEEIASELVEMEYSGLYKKSFYIDYDRPSLLLKFAKESFISAVESKGFHWLKHNIKPFSLYDPRSKTGCHDLEEEEIVKKQWQEAEEKTFKNPLIFVKNS